MRACAVLAQEAGIIIHSIFIGLSYGVETDYDTIRALTIALGFHQVRAASEERCLCHAYIKLASCSCTFTAAAFACEAAARLLLSCLFICQLLVVAVLVARRCSSLH